MEITTFKEYNTYLKQLLKSNIKLNSIFDKLDDEEITEKDVYSDSSISEKEFIELIAILRKDSYKDFLGGGNKTAEAETDREYAKNPWKFIEEFLQNADDCNYKDVPEVSIIIDENKSAIEFIYNEIGFSREDIWAITAFSSSTKDYASVINLYEEGVFYREKTGRKGKGFKSVFSLDADNIVVHIRSNGFSFKLDNRIGRILPVWEDDEERLDGKTHVIVELINPSIDLKNIYPEFRRLFCIDNRDEIFAKSPFLFMHRIKSVNIKRINIDGENSFTTQYFEDNESTTYGERIELDTDKTIWAGIVHNDVYYKEQFQYGTIVTSFDSLEDEMLQIPVIRYTKMIEDENAYRNYSIIAPLLSSDLDNDLNWKIGSLFRTFPMSKHIINIPLAIDAPFELNPDRSGIQYRDEKKGKFNSSKWNTEVAENLFCANGVLVSFFNWIRTIENIRIDNYFTHEIIEDLVKLFDISDNYDGHGNSWVKIYNVSSIVRDVPVFRLLSDESKFVNYNDAVKINEHFYKWPHVCEFLLNLIGNDYEKTVISDIYCDSRLDFIEFDDNKNLLYAINSYVDLIENEYGIDSEDFIDILSSCVYPYLISDYSSVESMINQMKIAVWRYYDGEKEKRIREERDHNTYIETDDVRYEKLCSFGKFRLWNSSVINVELIDKLLRNSYCVKHFSIELGEDNINNTAKKYRKWEDAFLFIKTAVYYSVNIDNLKFVGLKGYCISKKYDNEFNPYRESGIYQEIPDSDIEDLQSCLMDSVSGTVEKLKNMGIGMPETFFVCDSNARLSLSDDTIKLFKITDDAILDKTFLLIDSELAATNNKLDVHCKELEGCNRKVLLYFINKEKSFLVDTYQELCFYCQSKDEFWNDNDYIISEILIRALFKSNKKVSNAKDKELLLSIEDIIKYKWIEMVSTLIEEKDYGFITILNNEFFDEHSDTEVLPLIQSLAPDKVDDSKGIHFYYGNFGNTNVKYINDGDSVYLHKTVQGDIFESLTKYLGTKYDKNKIKIIQDMQSHYADDYENIIEPAIEHYKGEFVSVYNEVEQKYYAREISNKSMINILSWFRYNGRAAAFGNGNISQEDNIKKQYKEESWRFVYEFIQNVDDCKFNNKHPELDVRIEVEKNRVIFTYNEDGFTFEDIKALTQFGASKKKERKDELYIDEGVFDLTPTGEKGFGFKSVFALPGEDIVVHIRSNSFCFKFVKRLGVIVPIWEDSDNIDLTGTQIIVEGFKEKTIDNFYDKLKEILGFGHSEEFFATCPVLFLRKLKKLTIGNGNESCHINIDSEQVSFENETDLSIKDVSCGIIHNGSLFSKVIEKKYIDVSTMNEPIIAIQVSEFLKTGNNDYVISALAPVITQSSECVFTKGSLFTTLPVSGNSLPIPVALNSRFSLNDNRSKLYDSAETDNNFLIEKAFGSLIHNLYSVLACSEGIMINNYIPGNNSHLFGDEAYKNIRTINLSDIICHIPILKPYSGNRLIPINEAVALPAALYKWACPDKLVSMMENSGKKILVCEENCETKNIQKCKFKDAESCVKIINEYLSCLTDEECISTVSKYIIDYIKDNQKLNPNDTIKELNILSFKMSDGSIVRECINNEECYFAEGTELKSCGNIRTMSSLLIDINEESYNWIFESVLIKEIKDIIAELSKENYKYAKNKPDVLKLICALIYYGFENTGKIKFLRKCALDEKFDREFNVFRDAFVNTKDSRILSDIIEEKDIIEISETLSSYDLPEDKTDIYYIVSVLKEMGLRRASDYFENNNNVVKLNRATIAIFEKYSEDQLYIEKLIEAINEKKKSKKDYKNLNIEYKDINNCGDSFVAAIIKNRITNNLKQLGTDYLYSNLTDCKENVNKAEALLRCLAICDDYEEENKINIEVNLTDIIERKLGGALQKAFLQHLSMINLTIITDEIKLDEYPKEDINQVLEWMGTTEESVLSDVSYLYYEYDLRNAFEEKDDATDFFVLDNDKVILDKYNRENCMLSFVQKRFKGEAEKYQIMLSIRKKQNELQHWDEDNKTKEDYIKALCEYRKENKKVLEDLCPDIEEIYNNSTEDSISYVIPELLQNINDCQKGSEESERILSIDIDNDAGTMILSYPEKGFDYKNVYSITSIGKSTKNDSSEGEKGLGFKRVFSVFEDVEIYSNDFCFHLSHEDKTINNTIPKWIGDQKKQKKYLKNGYTTMVMKVKKNRNSDLIRLKNSWDKVFIGQFDSDTFSPLFLSNIDGYELDGTEHRLLRSEIEKGYFYKSINISETYRKLLEENMRSLTINLQFHLKVTKLMNLKCCFSNQQVPG